MVGTTVAYFDGVGSGRPRIVKVISAHARVHNKEGSMEVGLIL